ncbi:MAG: prepilin-type N-terminal cleavage/methylation domain-containing protein [Polyangiaceae bacterium]
MTLTSARLARGFTLVELLTVVTIVGVLSTTAIVLVGRHVRASRTVEAVSMVQSIRAAEERYHAENRAYLSVSTTLTDYQPVTNPDGTRRSFYTGSGPKDARWRMLGPTVTGPVRFGYAVLAGSSDTQMAAPSTSSQPVWPVPTQDWYVVQASSGDPDNDGKTCYVVGSSLSGEVYVENEGE